MWEGRNDAGQVAADVTVEIFDIANASAFGRIVLRIVLWYKDEPIRYLTPIEFKILVYLIEHSPHTVSLEIFRKDVWENQMVLKFHTVEEHISNLKKKLPSTARKKIVTQSKSYKITD